MHRSFQLSFDDLSARLYDVTFCVLDLETTGGSAESCSITEIGAVKYRSGEPIGTFQSLIDPGLPIPPSIVMLTGITQLMVHDAPRIEGVLPAFLEFLGDAVVVGHNIRFDLSFLDAAATHLGYPRIGNPVVDTVALARRLVRPEVRNLKLRTLAAHFRSPVQPTHRALSDARATAYVFHSLLERAGTIGVTNLDDLLRLPTARGAATYSKLHLTEGLPRRPGVYVFRDRHGEPIYVGKASNLRTRVRQYFYGDPRRSITNMLRELASIDHRVCVSPLEAEITELRLIHTYRPRHNRRHRPPKSAHFVKVTAEPFPRLSLVRTLKEDGLAYLGPFRSRRTAETVMNAIWDAVPIRRCMSKPGSRTGRCAPAQLGVAACPCDGALDPAKYSQVVDRLLQGLDGKPSLLLDPLRQKMRRLSDIQRYEEAGWLRDRHDALARAIHSRLAWQSLTAAGWIELEDGSGNRVAIDHGRLVGVWPPGERPDIPQYPIDRVVSRDKVPSTLPQAEEMAVLWRWLTTETSALLSSTSNLRYPVERPATLKAQIAA